MAYLSPFPYTAAEFRAREAGLAVLGYHHAAFPPGLPCRSPDGTYLKAERAWVGPAELGCAGIGSDAACYAELVSTIHQISTPDLGTVLANIRRALLTVADYPQRHLYVEAHQPHWRGDPVTLANAWTVELDCAMRAQRVLPAELVTWLTAGNWARW